MVETFLLALAAQGAPALPPPRVEARSVAVARAKIVSAARIDFSAEARRKPDSKRVLVEFQ